MRIPSIDGGGIRGILPGQILVALEAKLKAISNNPQASIADYFDMVAGTSTGAILGASFVCPGQDDRPKFTAQDALNVYLEEGKAIFNSSLWRKITTAYGHLDKEYSAKQLERILKCKFGDTKLSELLKPTCFVAYDIQARSPVIFNQASANKKHKDFWVRDILRGSSAAPTYFEPKPITSINKKTNLLLVDGGVTANDPALCAYSEALKCSDAKGIKDMMIVSIGTGLNLTSYQYHQVKRWGKIAWGRPLVDLTIDCGTQMTKYHLKSIDSTIPQQKYFRIQPELGDASPEFDEVSTDNLIKLSNAGKQSAHEHDKELDHIANLLVNYSVG